LISITDDNYTAYSEFRAAKNYLSRSETSQCIENALGVTLEKRHIFKEKDDSTSVSTTPYSEGPFCIRAGNFIKTIKAEKSILATETNWTTSDNIYKIIIRPFCQEDIFLDKRKSEALIALRGLMKEYVTAGWDGYEAAPISQVAYEEAVRFIKMLPSDVSLPDASPEPTGSIAFEWYKGKKQVFVASVSGKNTIEYAGLFGNNKHYGTVSFGSTIPTIILYLIHRLRRADFWKK